MLDNEIDHFKENELDKQMQLLKNELAYNQNKTDALKTELNKAEGDRKYEAKRKFYKNTISFIFKSFVSREIYTFASFMYEYYSSKNTLFESLCQFSRRKLRDSFYSRIRSIFIEMLMPYFPYRLISVA